MTRDVEKLLSAIQDAVAELETLAKDGTSMASEQVGAMKESIRERLEQAAERIRGLERETRRRMQDGVKSADDYVKDNPWRSVGIAAAAAFLVGALVSHRK